MKAVDTRVLLGILKGEPFARNLLRDLRGIEVATTELSMLELSLQAGVGPPKGRGARRAAVERLRRKLTVLPIDARGVAEAARRGSRLLRGAELLRLVEWGALEAYGCEELFTRSRGEPGGTWRFRLTRVGKRRS